MNYRILTTTALIALLGGAAVAQTSTTTPSTTSGSNAASTMSAMTPMIEAQGVKVDGKTVTFPKITAEKEGYIVIHAMKAGQPDTATTLGHASVKKGENDNVKVTLDRDLTKGEKYVAMLHDETNNDGTFDYSATKTNVDTPEMLAGKPVTAQFTG